MVSVKKPHGFCLLSVMGGSSGRLFVQYTHSVCAYLSRLRNSVGTLEQPVVGLLLVKIDKFRCQSALGVVGEEVFQMQSVIDAHNMDFLAAVHNDLFGLGASRHAGRERHVGGEVGHVGHFGCRHDILRLWEMESSLGQKQGVVGLEVAVPQLEGVVVGALANFVQAKTQGGFLHSNRLFQRLRIVLQKKGTFSNDEKTDLLVFRNENQSAKRGKSKSRLMDSTLPFPKKVQVSP